MASSPWNMEKRSELENTFKWYVDIMKYIVELFKGFTR